MWSTFVAKMYSSSKDYFYVAYLSRIENSVSKMSEATSVSGLGSSGLGIIAFIERDILRCGTPI